MRIASTRFLVAGAGLLAVIVTAGSSFAVRPAGEKRGGRSNLDLGGGPAIHDRAEPLAAQPSPAVTSLAASLGTQGIVSLDGRTGTPRIIARLDDFLTEPSLQPASQIAL